MNGSSTGADKTVVFILSATRSGSTWLSFVLGSHENAAHLGEYYRPFTIRGHTACRLCEAKGLAECEVLHGIGAIDTRDAFDFAFERFRKQFLIDCSKNLDWLRRFAGSRNFRVKTIHLIRDPRAWFVSEKRRVADLSPEKAMRQWVDINSTIRSTIGELRLTSVTSFYCDLCIHPETSFPPICRHIGMPFEPDALDYWRKEHHGLGGNGAALNNLMRFDDARVVTCDDDFYRGRLQKRFFDSRWIREINDADRAAIERSTIVQDCLKILGRDFNDIDRQLRDGANLPAGFSQ